MDIHVHLVLVAPLESSLPNAVLRRHHTTPFELAPPDLLIGGTQPPLVILFE